MLQYSGNPHKRSREAISLVPRSIPNSPSSPASPASPPRVPGFGLFTSWDEAQLRNFAADDDVKEQNKVLLHNQHLLFRNLNRFVSEIGPAWTSTRHGETSNGNGPPAIDAVMNVYRDKYLAAMKMWLAADIVANQGMKNVFTLTKSNDAKHAMVAKFLQANKIVTPNAQTVSLSHTLTHCHTH